MARIDLRDCLIDLLDGLEGSAAVAQEAAPAKDATSLTLGTLVVNTQDGLLPVGARIKVDGETDVDAVHVVTSATPGGTSEAPTVAVVISPALGDGTYSKTGSVSIQAQELEIKIGDGDLKYTEADQYKYDKDRGHLDDVRQGDDEPMELALNFTFEHVRSGTGEIITPIEAIKRQGAASGWVSYAADKCQPYAVGVRVDDVRPCGSAERETYLFPDFRAEKREYDFKNANIAVNGKCNATEPIITRGA